MRKEVYIVIHADVEEIYDFKPVRNGLNNNKEKVK